MKRGCTNGHLDSMTPSFYAHSAEAPVPRRTRGCAVYQADGSGWSTQFIISIGTCVNQSRL